MSSPNPGSVVAAKAFLEAGNFRLAEAHLRPILAANPREQEAREVWCDMLIKQKKFADLETFANDWLGHDPRSEVAYRNLTGSFVARKEHKKATATLQRYRELFPASVAVHRALQMLIDQSCPSGGSKKASTKYDEAIAYFEMAGDEKNVLRFQSQAAFCRSDLTKAVRLGERSWAAGYTETSFASYMAMICFRSFRLAKSRHYSRLAWRAEPGHAVAAELLVLSWLVWFPPFLVAHACLRLASGIDHRREFGAATVSVAMIVAGIAVMALMDGGPYLVPAIVLAALYGAYLPFIGAIAQVATAYRRRAVRLSNY